MKLCEYEKDLRSEKTEINVDYNINDSVTIIEGAFKENSSIL